jgi:hypothetical protein
MTRRASAAVLLACLLGTAPARADLARAKAEPNLTRRARLAMENADLQMRAALAAGKRAEWSAAEQALSEIRESVDLAYDALKQAVRNPRNSSHYKTLEVRLRGLIKRLEEFRNTLDFEAREQLAPLVEHLRRVTTRCCQSIMAPKKK